jgi:hypothetical protein
LGGVEEVIFMSKQLPHAKIIHRVAKELLLPMGILQKGVSRLWIDDQRWWIIIIEFQPSDWGRGTYLNVGAHWLWHEQDFYSFDFGNRIDSFIKYINDMQFEDQFRKIIEKAVGEVKKYRNKFQNIHKVANILQKYPNMTSWNLFHAGIACGLDNQRITAKRLFTQLLEEESFLHLDKKDIELIWHRKLKERTSYLLPLLEKPELFSQIITQSIINSRNIYKLQHLDITF